MRVIWCRSLTSMTCLSFIANLILRANSWGDGKSAISQPGFQNWNLGLFKRFALSDRTGLQFRAEAFNFINHPNWGGGSGGGVQFNPTSSTFGKVTTKGGGTGGGERNLQLSLRLYF